ncbi:MAG: recombination protein RecR [Candidatus Omnitrophica bacterium]|nr:recombination protein RecR [Candidatus Omnitrophota bacterium]
MSYPQIIEDVITNLSKLPGLGRRSAERMVFWLLSHPPEEAQKMAQSIVRLKEEMRFCKVCNNFAEGDLCKVCQNPERDGELVCVVEDPKHLLAIERAGAYKGKYHVLLGTIAPAEGRGPEDLKVQQLLKRIADGEVQEVVIATDPDNEGEMTALFLSKILRDKGVKVSRIGLGLPMGSSVEYADISTLAMSLNARKEMEH